MSTTTAPGLGAPGSGAEEAPLAASLIGGGQAGGRVVEGKGETQYHAAAGPILRGDRPAMRFDDGPADGQAETHRMGSSRAEHCIISISNRKHYFF